MSKLLLHRAGGKKLQNYLKTYSYLITKFVTGLKHPSLWWQHPLCYNIVYYLEFVHFPRKPKYMLESSQRLLLSIRGFRKKSAKYVQMRPNSVHRNPNPFMPCWPEPPVIAVRALDEMKNQSILCEGLQLWQHMAKPALHEAGVSVFFLSHSSHTTSFCKLQFCFQLLHL